MSSSLPSREDLHPDDAAPVTLRPDGTLDLTDPASMHALVRTLARAAGLDPRAGVEFTPRRPYGWALTTPSRAVLIAGLRGVHAPYCAPGIDREPDTPSGRRRAAVRAWRAVAAP